MQVKDIPEDAMFISTSQDVAPILADFGVVDDDIGGVFITKDGKVYGISGSVAYLEYHVFYEERGQGVEKTHGFNRGMNRTPCITTENYKSNKGINYLLTCTAPLR